MKLDEFVKQSLLDITEGVADTQETSLLYVAPGYVNKIRQDGAQIVKFEVAVTVNAEGGGGISVLSFGDRKRSIARDTVSRVRLEVPVHFTAPTIHNKRHHKNEGPMDPLKE